MLVALLAVGAALALTATPISPAHAGLFGGGDVKVERGRTSDLPCNGGTGTKVGTNSDVRRAPALRSVKAQGTRSGRTRSPGDFPPLALRWERAT